MFCSLVLKVGNIQGTVYLSGNLVPVEKNVFGYL